MLLPFVECSFRAGGGGGCWKPLRVKEVMITTLSVHVALCLSPRTHDLMGLGWGAV